ncbi:MAG: branched-chain amino acid ABC transporter permease, partial [Pseudomonadota bacterium]
MHKSTIRALLKGFFDMLPLCLAVLPWGILCGSLAVQNGFSALETQAM